MKGHVVLAGGAGFIGNHVALRLQGNGYEVKLLSRQPGKGLLWDGKSPGAWTEALEGARAIINLAGARVATRWTSENRKEIALSRIETTQTIGRAIRQCKAPPAVWINASAVGYYGNTGEHVIDENAAAGRDFLAKVCTLWEKALFDVQTSHTRKHSIRIGVVLGVDGGSLPILVKLTKAFLGGSAGNGRQWVPWIHIGDLARMFAWVVETDDAPPILNGSAPTPVTNAHLMRCLRTCLHRPWAAPAPAFALMAAQAFSRFPTELALCSQRAAPKAALTGGFTFEHPQLDEALADLLRS